MELKTCAYCHKVQQVQRVETSTCIQCGQSFGKKASKNTLKNVTRPSIPSASPHQAGHYFGLHPEDQPYQSSMIVVNRAPHEEVELRYRSQQEPEHIVFPATDKALAIHVPPAEQHRQPRKAGPLLKRPAVPAYARRQALLSSRGISLLLSISCILFLLASSIIAFVLIGKQASGATTAVEAMPNVLRVHDTFVLSGHGFGPQDLMAFTFDQNKTVLGESGRPLEAHTDLKGSFSVTVRVPETWMIGSHSINAIDEAQGPGKSTRITIQPPSTAPARLQVMTKNCCQFEADAPGVISSKALTISNAGGGVVSWQGSSDQSWLMLAPNSGTFSGSQNIQVMVNRGGVAAGTYTGNVLLKQSGSDDVPVRIAVTMAVTGASPALTLSTGLLTYGTTAGLDPADQFMTLQNDGTQALNWSSTVTTGNGASWLTLIPASGSIDPGAIEGVRIKVQARQLLVGSYQGQISFADGATAQVKVALTVAEAPTPTPTATPTQVPTPTEAPLPTATVGITPTPTPLVDGAPAISVQPVVINLSALKGTQPASASVTITNSGHTILNWSMMQATDAVIPKLTLNISQGSINAGASVVVTITCESATLASGTYATALIVNDSDQGTTVVPQRIPVTLSVG